MKNTFLVIVKRPYYPSVDEYDDFKAAFLAYKKLVEESNDDDGEHKSKVYLCVQVNATDIRTHY